MTPMPKEISAEPITQILKDFYKVTGIRVLFQMIDTGAVFCYPKTAASFCSLIRQDKEIEKKCLCCDREGIRRAKEQGGVYVYSCHMGFIEAVAPVLIAGDTVGYLMLGQILDKEPSLHLFEKIYEKLENPGIDRETLLSAFMKTGYMEMDRIKAAANIMKICADFICLSRLVDFSSQSFKSRLEHYYYEHTYMPASLTEVAAYFNVSVSYISHTVKKETGLSFTSFVNGVKMTQAKELLEMTGSSVEAISLALGYKDVSYFTRVFKSKCNISPFQYRKRAQNAK